MPNIQIRFHPDAAAEVEAAVRWYSERSHVAAQSFFTELSACIERLEGAPGRWLHYLQGTRRYLLPHFPFSLVYRLRNDKIEIVAVAHHLRQPGYWRIR